MPPMADVYELEPEVPRPKLPGSVVLSPSEHETADALAADLYIHAVNCVRSFGDFHIALPGGRSPQALYRTLMIDPAYREFPWKRTHIWLVSDSAPGPSAAEIIRDIVVVHGDVPRDQFHPMDLTAKDPDAAYSKALREHLGWREKGHDRLDYVLLGLGSDGSTAGYPAPSILPDGEECLAYLSNHSGERTLSLALRVINAARFVAVVATGAGKRAGLECAMKSSPGSPIAGVRPVGGTLRWYVDEPACTGAETGAER